MGRLQTLAIVAGISLCAGLGFGWLREHDRRIKAHVIMEQQEQDAKQKDEQIEGFRESLIQLNESYVQQKIHHSMQRRIMEDSTNRLKVEIGWLATQIQAQLPDSAKHLATDVAEACGHQVELVKRHLASCDAIVAKADTIMADKDSMIALITGARDDYRDLYKTALDVQPSEAWATVGKVETGVGVVALVTRFLGLWGKKK